MRGTIPPCPSMSLLPGFLLSTEESKSSYIHILKVYTNDDLMMMVYSLKYIVTLFLSAVVRAECTE
jgi:hypothetical protein